MQTENSKILALFNPTTRNTNRFESLSSGANGVIYKNKVSGGLIKVSKKFNLSGNNNKLNNEKKAEKRKYYAHATKVLGNAVRQEFEITKRVYEELKKMKVTPFVPEVSNLRTAKNGGMALFKMSRVPGMTLTRFARDPKTTEEDLEEVKRQCLAYVKKLKQMGILHGDLNPNNIMVKKYIETGKIEVHLIDFGRSLTIGQLPPGTATYNPWPIHIGCRGDPRLCALPYTVPPNNKNQPYMLNNEALRAVFPKNKVVSYSNQLKNLHKILTFQINSTPLTSNFKNRLLRRVNIPEAIKNKIKTKNVVTSRVNYKPIETVLEYMNLLESIKNTLPKTPTTSSKKSGCGMFGCFGGPSQKYV
jgi:serine/threonine protein kinase